MYPKSCKRWRRWRLETSWEQMLFDMKTQNAQLRVKIYKIIKHFNVMLRAKFNRIENQNYFTLELNLHVNYLVNISNTLQ